MPADRRCSEPLPKFLSPMLCSPGDVRERDGWVLQLKWDGIRGQLRSDGSGWTLRSRPGHDRSSCFPELDVVHQALGRASVLLDGEVVVLDEEGRPDFSAVRRRLVGAAAREATFVVWDVLHVDGEAVRDRPLDERLALLQDLLPAEGAAWRLAEPLEGRPEDVLSIVAEHQLEGVIAKDPASRWVPERRSSAWLKHKLRRRHELVVSAWQPAVEDRVDVFHLRDLRGRAAGQVSFGLSGAERAALRDALLDLEIGTARRGSLRLTEPKVLLTVDAHGADGQPLRDAVIRAWRPA